MSKSRGSFVIVNVMLIACGSLLGFKSYERLQSSRILYDPAKASSHSVISEQTQPGNHPLSYYQSIIDRDLFNTRIESGKSSKPINPETLPPTDLALKLWGTATGDEETSYAVIQDTKQRGRKRRHTLYKTGDLIRNAKLAKIYRDKVVLKVDGKNEILKLEQYRGRAYGPRNRIRAQSSKRPRTRVFRRRRAALTRAMNIAKRLPANDQVRQHRAGIYLYRINRNPALIRLGLRNRDIITAINGRAVRSVNEISKIYHLVQSRRRFNLAIKRRGRPTTIRYIIR